MNKRRVKLLFIIALLLMISSITAYESRPVFFLSGGSTIMEGEQPDILLTAMKDLDINIRCFEIINPAAFFNSIPDIANPNIESRELENRIVNEAKDSGNDWALVLKQQLDEVEMNAGQNSLDLTADTKGVYLVEASGDGQKAFLYYNISDLGVVVKKSQSKALIFVQNRENGQLVSGAAVSIVQDGRVIASGSTDSQGIYSAAANVIADFTVTVQTEESFAVINPRYFPEDVKSTKLYVFTERPVYRPGERVFFQGIIKEYENGSYSTGRYNQVEVNITDSMDNPVNDPDFENQLQVSSLGGFWSSFMLSENSHLGRYKIDIQLMDKHYISFFKVEEYRKPKFEVMINLEDEPYIKGDPIKASIEAINYTNIPVSSGQAVIKVFKSQYYMPDFHPEEYGWLFTDYERQNIEEELVEEINATLNEDGLYELEIQTDAGADQNYSYRISVEITDPLSGERVSESKTTLVTQSEFAIVVNTSKNLYELNEEGEITVEVRDYKGNPVPGVNLNLQLDSVAFQEMPTASNTTQFSNLPEHHNYTNILSSTVTTDLQGKASLVFIATSKGYVRASANGEDSRGNSVDGETFFWIEVGNEVFSLPSSSGEIICDKDSYNRSDSLLAMILLPYPDRKALITVEGSVLYQYEVATFNGLSYIYELPLSSIDTLNIMIKASYYYQGEYYETYKEIIIPPEDRFLSIDIQTDKEEYEPRDNAEVTVTVKDHNGNPIQGEVAIGVVDSAIYGVSRSIIPGIQQYFYNKREYNVKGYESQSNRSYGVADTRWAYSGMRRIVDYTALALAFYGCGAGHMQARDGGSTAPPQDEVSGTTRTIDQDDLYEEQPVAPAESGTRDREMDYDRPEAFFNGQEERMGGISTEPPQRRPGADGRGSSIMNEISSASVSLVSRGVMTAGSTQADSSSGFTRRELLSTVFFRGNITTDRNGQATVSFRFPDNITSWRINVVAYTADGMIGTEQKRVKTLKKLFVMPSLPRFLVERDSAKFACVVYNNTDSEREVELSFETNNLQISGTNAQKYIQNKEKIVIPAHRGTDVSFTITAVRHGIDRLRFRANFSGTRIEDGLEQELFIIPYGAQRVIGESGIIAQGGTEQKISLPDNIVPGTLQIGYEVSPNWMKAVVSAIDYMVTYPYGCTEQTMNKFLPTVVASKVMRDLNIVNTRLSSLIDEYVESGLTTLYNYQHEDGGWGWWKEDETKPQMSAYVMSGLALTKQAGYDVMREVIMRGKISLNQMLRDPSLDRTTGAEIYQALALNGDNDSTYLQLIKNQGINNDIYSAALIANGLYALQKPNEAQFFLDILENEIKVHPNLENAMYWNGSSDPKLFSEDSVEITALGLKALSSWKPDLDSLEKVINYLMQTREGNHWKSTKDSAVAIMGILEYVKQRGVMENSGEVSVYLNDELFEEKQISGNINTAQRDYTILPDLHPGQDNVIEFNTTSNLAMYYNVYGSYVTQADYIPSSSSGIEVQRIYYRLKQYDLGNRRVYEPEVVRYEDLKVGDVILVQLNITSNEALSYLQVDDPIPAGCEVIREVRDYPIDGMDLLPGNEHREFYDERSIFFYSQVPVDGLIIRYLLDCRYEGSFHVLPADAKLMYFPSVRGTSDSLSLTISK